MSTENETDFPNLTFKLKLSEIFHKNVIAVAKYRYIINNSLGKNMLLILIFYEQNPSKIT